MLKETFFSTLGKYSVTQKQSESYWKEVVSCYSENGRYYHTLTHIKTLFDQLENKKHFFQNWDAVFFAIVYHDIIYNVSFYENEEKSAELARERLSNTSFPSQNISLCVSQILATKEHSDSESSDTNLFLDADLSILGQNRI
ncbi:HD domain-containing protein [Leptospira idonii]|uniref:Phosphohydrolase n=1 Tax=Leptospira idonii TaxID=1193500 RepID=A0A4R9M101_9LEPT|nr:hypothetical protein [Leptospira idonii]TGN18398.1 hypothetical protein EHS15_13440 [Leptospira idonii]